MSTDIESLRTVLVIRNQQLTPEHQVATSQLFGVLDTFHGPASRTPLAEIFRVASRPEDGHVEVGRYWHSDGSFILRQLPCRSGTQLRKPRTVDKHCSLTSNLRIANSTMQPKPELAVCIGGMATELNIR